MSIFDIIKNAINTVVDPLLFGDATVYRKARVPNGRGGFTYVATQHACRALVIEYTDFQRSVDGIPASNRQLLLAADSLAVEFKTDDVIGFPDGSFWKPVTDVIEPTKSLLTIQVATAPAPMVGAVGTGIFNVGNFTFSGTGVAANVGIGEWNVSEFTFYGEGEASEAEPLEGTGDFTYSFTFEAAAVATLPGSADLTIDEFTFLGEGRQDAGAVGDWTYDFTFLGSGYGSNIAIADITIDEFTFSATGVETSTATAAITIDEFSFTGTGVGTSTATASLTIGEFTFTGTGVGTLIATAAITIPEFTFSGAGAQSSPLAVASASWSWNGASSSNRNVNKPSGVQSGDLLIAFTWATNPGVGAWDFGYGDWNEVADDTIVDGSEPHYYHIAWKVAGSSEPTTYQFTDAPRLFPDNGYYITFVARVTGSFNATTPLGDYDASVGSRASRRLPSLTVGSNNSLVVFATDGDSPEDPTGLGLGRHINGGGLDLYSKLVNAGSSGIIDVPMAATAFQRTWGVIVNPG